MGRYYDEHDDVCPVLKVHDHEGNQIPPQVILERLHKGVYHKQAMAAAQERQARLTRALGPRRHGKNFRVIASVDPVVYAHWRRRFSHELDANGNPVNPWEHDEFIRDLQRDNPEMRPMIEKPQHRVGYGDGKGLVRATKYTKIPA